MPHPLIEHTRARAGRIGRRMTLAARLSAAVLARAQQEAASGKPAYWYGGQAIIEGVMMRGRYVAAIAVRNPKQNIVIKEVPLNAALYRGRAARLPFVRGLVLLWDALVLGTSALMWSADVALEEEEDIDFSLEGAAGFGLVIFSLALGIGLFFVLPAAASAAVKSLTGLDSKLAADLIEGLIKLALLIGYIWAIGFMQDVKRLFGYHGAEHKTINAYEAGADLTVESVRRYSVQHVRCGTSFLLYVLVISILLFAPLTFAGVEPDWLALLLRFVTRLLLVPVVAGIAYEIIRFSAAHARNPLMRALIAPGLALQRLTTREPDDSMIECAIAALEPVLAADGIDARAVVHSPRILAGAPRVTDAGLVSAD